jgi:hypothetical protein
MKARQLELRAIPQFDSGRWKLRLERVPLDPDNETTIGLDFDSATQTRVSEINEAHCSCYQSSAANANDKHPVERIGRRQRLAKQAPIRSRYPQSHSRQ